MEQNSRFLVFNSFKACMDYASQLQGYDITIKEEDNGRYSLLAVDNAPSPEPSDD